VAVLAPPEALAGDEGGNLVWSAATRRSTPSLAERAARPRRSPGSVAVGQQAERFAGDASILTDDDAPVDQLLSPYRARRE
jgi:hypothetical protein